MFKLPKKYRVISRHLAAPTKIAFRIDANMKVLSNYSEIFNDRIML